MEDEVGNACITFPLKKSISTLALLVSLVYYISNPSWTNRWWKIWSDRWEIMLYEFMWNM
jgi:hypothetical protein